MQQQQQPGMPPFWPTAGAGTTTAQPSPISSRPPEGHPEPGAGGSAPRAEDSFDHEGDRSGSSVGSRWPRQETLALLKIRSEMDAAFREAALKGPLWEEVSRKLAAMGYNRNAKKCREKFENVDKYYKRTKDGRAGRGDGKAYRFFSELEALHGASSPHPPESLAPTPVALAPPAPLHLSGVRSMAPAMHAEPPQPPPVVTMTSAAPTGGTTATCTFTAGDVSFSSSSDGEDTEETGDGGKRKRKRRDGDGGRGSSKMMRFCEGLMRQVMERQEVMQQRFIEAIERREQERMIREEAWRRQELAHLAREQDALAQERAMAASRDAAVVSFIQRITGQTIPVPTSVPAPQVTMISALKPTPVASAAPAPPPPPQHYHRQPPSSVQLPAAPKPHTAVPPISATQTQRQTPQTESKDATVVRALAESQDTAGSGGAPSPSRWPKAEVHALIQLRTELEARYQDSSPKGPLWEDISAGMRRLGYNRNAKRCKEKWENINKYFKKVKESNKKRPEDSKTCPYYHQLDALYRSKALASSGAGGSAPHPRPEAVTVLAAVPLSQTAPHHQVVTGGGNKQDCNTGNGNRSGCCASENGGRSGDMQTPGSNGGVSANTIRLSTEGPGGNGTATKNKEDNIITKETAPAEETPQPVSMNDSYAHDRMDAGDDSDSMDDDEDDSDEDEDEGDVGSGGNNNNKTMQYEIQFQRQHQSQSQSQSGVVRPNASGGAGSGPGPATASGSFLTMVHH